MRVVNLLSGITLAAVIVFAFWLGSTNNAITQSAEKVDKLHSVVLDPKEGVGARISVVETKLDSIEKKLDSVDRKLSEAK